MADGYAVLTGDGGTTPGAGQADAARWLEDFAEFEDEHDGYRLLYGSPDLAALVHDKQRSVAKSAAAARPTGRGHPGPTPVGHAHRRDGRRGHRSRRQRAGPGGDRVVGRVGPGPRPAAGRASTTMLRSSA